MAQFTVLPLHLGAFPACVEGLLRAYEPCEMATGDSFVVNHPYLGGSPHATDVAVISPILVEGTLFGFSGSIAHKSDIGGLVPGTNSGQAREIFHEGLMIPPVRFYRDGAIVREVEAILCANSRTPELIMGDLRGQVGATWLGAERVRALCGKHGAATVAEATERLFRLTEQRVRSAVRTWPDGIYEGESWLHNDAMEGGRPVRVHVRASIDGDRIHFDFSGSHDQTGGPYNIRPPLVRAVCYYALKCLIDPELPSNQGLADAVETEFRPRSLLCPESPAPVNNYMRVAVTTAEAIFDALGKAVPQARIAESSSGANGTLSYARGRRGYPQVQYELPAGAIGARPHKDGVSASKAHVANGGLTPIEIIETEFPVELIRFELIPDSGGAGRQRGGLAYVREYRFLGDSTFSARGGQQLTAPVGREGGHSGRRSTIVVNPGTPDERVVSAKDGTVRLGTGDVLRMEQAGAGGFGDPRTRPVELVLRDVQEGYVSPEAARAEYGVVVIREGHSWVVDEGESARLRRSAQKDKPTKPVL
jgi:N-methylhydantoinase B